MLTLDSCPKLNPEVVGRKVDNEAVVVLPEKGKVEVLNEVGAFIWERVDGNRTLGDIAEDVCQTFDVEPAQAERDVLEFATDLLKRQVLLVD